MNLLELHRQKLLYLLQSELTVLLLYRILISAGNKGKDAGAGNKLAGYGVTTVILSLVSTV
ncbi:unnamed protein product [Thlaspi arvense]|uniref:Maturase K n=1 Tax=Thlaspi arvense TaxID=13288 RepID=A0AAU9RUU6_THLAR|nr:unnamed protein product [Thlaspi arvense]